jgi:hypothetical protein
VLCPHFAPSIAHGPFGSPIAPLGRERGITRFRVSRHVERPGVVGETAIVCRTCDRSDDACLFGAALATAATPAPAATRAATTTFAAFTAIAVGPVRTRSCRLRVERPGRAFAGRDVGTGAEHDRGGRRRVTGLACLLRFTRCTRLPRLAWFTRFARFARRTRLLLLLLLRRTLTRLAVASLAAAAAATVAVAVAGTVAATAALVASRR